MRRVLVVIEVRLYGRFDDFTCFVLCFCISGYYFVYFGCCGLSIDVVDVDDDDDYMF